MRLIALLLPAVGALAIWSAAEPRWETNDDPAMMMLAHGFGLGGSSSPTLIYSNVVWGYVVWAMPWVGGMPGYSIASMAALLIAAAAIAYSLLRLGVALPMSALAIGLCLLRPLIFWQFTVIAGLLAVSGVLCLLAALRDPPRLWMVAGAFTLLFAGALIRAGETMLVVAVALPLLARTELLARRDVQIGAASLAVLLAAAFAIDRAAYAGDDWTYFHRFEEVRVPITDFQAGERLQASPQVMERHTLQLDEVKLLEGWGFVSPELTDPDRLGRALAEIGHYEHGDGAVAGARSAVSALWRPGLIWLWVAALGLFALRPSLRLLLCWCVMMIAIGALGALGRPGVERVYVPILVLLVLAPIVSLAGDASFRWLSWRGTLATALCGLALVLHAPPLLSNARQHAAMFSQYRSAVDALGGEDLVGWGWRVPYEYMYPPFGPIPSIDAKHLSLGAFTYAPNTHIFREEQDGRGLLARLRTPEGILVAAGEPEYQLLKRYLQRRFGESLSAEPVLSVPRMQVSRWRLSSSAGGEAP